MRRMTFVALCAVACSALPGWAEQAFSFTRETPIHMPGATRVHDTALRELASIWPGADPQSLDVQREDTSPPGSVFVGLLAESKVAQELAKQGVIGLGAAKAELDAFELRSHGGALFLLGNSPRGMLQAIYTLQEWMRAGMAIEAGAHAAGTIQFRERFFHPRFNNCPGERADIRFISHLGASHCLLTHDWQGNRRHMQGYVASPLYPDAVDAGDVRGNHAGLRTLIEACLDYGIEPCLWITELPCQGGPWVPEATRQRFLERFPKEVLSDSGTYQGQVLCFSHPQVQAFYRDLIARFFKDFPEISTFYLFGLDADGEFCSPDLCVRCKGMSKFEQRDRLIRFLIEEGQKVRPGLRVLTTGWGWASDTEEFLARQKELPASSGLYLAAETDGWQPERQLHDLMWRARAICRERGQTFIGYDDFQWGDDTVHDLNDIQDFPLGIGAKLRRWHVLGVDGVFDHWGGFNEDISCNAIACRAFFFAPEADPNEVCQAIAVRQFGAEAGARAFAGWQALEKAHAILSKACTWPPGQWPGWYGGREYAPTAEGFAAHRMKGGEPPRQGDGILYNPPELAARLQAVGDAWRAAFPLYQEASRCLGEASALASADRPFYAYWWAGEAKVPSCGEHLRREQIYVDSMGAVGREIGLYFELNALYERLAGDGGAYRSQARALLAEDVVACRNVADLLDALKASGDDRRADRGWAALYRAKADAIEAYLK